MLARVSGLATVERGGACHQELQSRNPMPERASCILRGTRENPRHPEQNVFKEEGLDSRKIMRSRESVSDAEQMPTDVITDAMKMKMRKRRGEHKTLEGYRGNVERVFHLCRICVTNYI